MEGVFMQWNIFQITQQQQQQHNLISIKVNVVTSALLLYSLCLMLSLSFFPYHKKKTLKYFLNAISKCKDTFAHTVNP